MASNHNEFTLSVWIDEQEKIASFHPVEGYRKHTYQNHECFMEFLRTLQQVWYALHSRSCVEEDGTQAHPSCDRLHPAIPAVLYRRHGTATPY